jgi:DNA modification methylase
MLAEKAKYRLKDLPDCGNGRIKLVDERRISSHFRNLHDKVALVVTSPPYLSVTRYEEDQWLRLWFLGGEPRPTYGKISRDDRHETTRRYWQFLKESWVGLRPLMKDSAKIVIRLGAIGLDQDEMTSQLELSIQSAFPNAHLLEQPKRSEIIGRQANSFLPGSKGCLFEMDYVFAL